MVPWHHCLFLLIVDFFSFLIFPFSYLVDAPSSICVHILGLDGSRGTFSHSVLDSCVIYLPLYLLVHNSFFLIRPLFICAFSWSLVVDVLSVAVRGGVRWIIYSLMVIIRLYFLPSLGDWVDWDRFVYLCLGDSRDDDVRECQRGKLSFCLCQMEIKLQR